MTSSLIWELYCRQIEKESKLWHCTVEICDWRQLTWEMSALKGCNLKQKKRKTCLRWKITLIATPWCNFPSLLPLNSAIDIYVSSEKKIEQVLSVKCTRNSTNFHLVPLPRLFFLYKLFFFGEEMLLLAPRFLSTTYHWRFFFLLFFILSKLQLERKTFSRFFFLFLVRKFIYCIRAVIYVPWWEI